MQKLMHSLTTYARAYSISFFMLCFLQIYHSSLLCFNFGPLWPKNEQETLTKEYEIQNNCNVSIQNTEGSVTVKQWNQNKIAVEVIKKGNATDIKATTINCKVHGSEAQITTRVPVDTDNKIQKTAQVQYIIMVPEEASISVMQCNGPVKVKGILGSIAVSLEKGSIEITDATKTVDARTGAGDIILYQKRFDQPHSIFLATPRGNINLYMPRKTRAQLFAKTVSGTIVSDHEVILAEQKMKINAEGWDRLKKNVEGTLGDTKGGAPITLETTKGSIKIKEY